MTGDTGRVLFNFAAITVVKRSTVNRAQWHLTQSRELSLEQNLRTHLDIGDHSSEVHSFRRIENNLHDERHACRYLVVRQST